MTPVPDVKKKYPSVNIVGVAGAGLMGASIAVANIRSGIPVRIYDVSDTALESLQTRVLWELRYWFSESDAEKIASLIRICSLSELAECPLIIEAVPERPELKRTFYEQIEPLMTTRQILASNTSTLSVSSLARYLKHPERFAGLHFLHPVRKRELVEVIRTPYSDNDTVQTLCDYALFIEKTPLCMDDHPGFVVNRLLQPYLGEALLLLEEGIQPSQIESASINFGMEWGPLRFLDEIGLDVALHCGQSLSESYPETIRHSGILITLVKQKRLGRKVGTGFYDWTICKETSSRDISPDVPFNAQTLEILSSWRKRVLKASEKQDHHFLDVDIAARLVLAMALEAARIVQDGVISDPGQIDMAAVTGLGFPDVYEGPLAWLNRYSNF